MLRTGVCCLGGAFLEQWKALEDYHIKLHRRVWKNLPLHIQKQALEV